MNVQQLDTTPPEETSATARPDRTNIRTRLGAAQRQLPIVQVLALVALFEWGTWTITDFATRSSILSMLVAASFLGLAGAGQTLVVLVGGIDFSVPAFISGGSVVISQLTGAEHWSFVPALLVIVVLGLSLGAVNGYISHRFSVQPLVVTLAMASIITGAVLVWTKGQQPPSAPQFLEGMTSVTGSTFGLGIPPVVSVWVAVAIVLAIGLRQTAAGRRLYATGANPVAARLTLIKTRRVWVAVYALSGLLSALLGILLAGYSGSGNISLGDPYLFEGLAAVIVGGTAFGARGSYSRTVLGALVLTVLTTVLIGKGYSNADQQIIFGLLILVVVAGYGRDSRLRDRL
jgi:ribose transport system permease protein